MGWDAFSTAMRSDGSGLVDIAHFAVVARQIERQGHVVDGLLAKGGLDCDDCGEMLARATRTVLRDPKDDHWDANRVADLVFDARWDFAVEPEAEWAKLSARAFLETCALYGHGIVFSW